MMGGDLAPPIIPGRTQIAPGAMRALLRANAPDEDEMEPDLINPQGQEPKSEQGLLAEFGNLFWKAGEYPGLQDVMLSFAKALKKAADQRHMISPQQSPPTLRMPTSMMMPPLQARPEETAPQGDLLAMLLGGGAPQQ